MSIKNHVKQFRSFRLARGTAQSLYDGRLEGATHQVYEKVDGGYDCYDVIIEGDISSAVNDLKREGYEVS